MKTENIENYLNSFANNVVKESKALLQKDKGNTALGKSIRAVVTPDPNGFSVKFYMADYGTFLDKGVSGNKKKRSFINYKGMSESSPYSYTTKGPPIDILSKWVKKKGLKPKGFGRGRDKKTGRFISGLAIYISKKIRLKGIPSLSFFSKPLGINYKDLQENFLKQFSKDVTTYITTFTKQK
tara:strand:- start:1309 stop:1854 length:546 start_codon:yes stop_codon:yes gene_type:complete